MNNGWLWVYNDADTCGKRVATDEWRIRIMGAAGAGAAATANAIKASGAIVEVTPYEFVSIASRVDTPLVVMKEGGSGWFAGKYQYLTSYKGLIFHTKSAEPVQFTIPIELIVADRIWIPGTM
jgi:hypothetical protein